MTPVRPNAGRRNKLQRIDATWKPESVVNCFEIEAAPKTDDGVIGMLSSRLATPYPCSYTGTPFRLTPSAQPGEPGLSHCAKSLSTFAETDSACGRLQAAAIANPPAMLN